MILDAESLELVNAVESLLEGAADERREARADGVGAGDRDLAAADTARPGAAAGAAHDVAEAAGGARPAIGSAGTHPFAMWEDQRIVGRDRYRDLVSDLRFVARQELLFGQHVHVGLDDAEKAIHVANGMRVHLPVLLALSAISPFWRARRDGPRLDAHADLPAFPRVGIPPTTTTGPTTRPRSRFMVDSGVIDDYTYLWYDVRPHPNFGTVEIG